MKGDDKDEEVTQIYGGGDRDKGNIEKEIEEIFSFYNINEDDKPPSKEEQKKGNDKPTPTEKEIDFGLEFGFEAKPQGLAVLVNLKLGLN